MEEHKDINNRLDELFAKARTVKPVMGVDEVRNLIATAPIATASNSDKSTRNNSSLYMLLAGIAIVAVSIGVWSLVDFSNDPPATVPMAVNSNTGDNQSNSGSSSENSSTVKEISENANNVNTETPVIENNTANPKSADNTGKDVESKTVTESTEKPKSAEVVPDASKNKTYLVTGGDFVVNFETDDKNVKMKLNDDDVKELSINGKAIASSDYPKYKDLIEKGKKMMETEKTKNPSTAANSKTPEEQKRDEINTRLFTAFTDQLKKDKLINEDKYSFKLTSSELLIDGKPQPDAVRQKYIDLFKSSAGRDLGGATFKFDHGMN